MKWYSFAATLVAVLCSNTTTSAQVQRRAMHRHGNSALEIFSFQGENTETAADTAKFKECEHRQSEFICAKFDTESISGVYLGFLIKTYNDNTDRLDEVIGEFGTSHFGDVLLAFNEKYGKPAFLGTKKWQNKAGGVFGNSVAIWDFKDGKLELDSLGSSLDYGSFTFISSANTPSPPTPKIDL